MLAGAGRRRRHRGDAAKSEDGDANTDLLLKHPNATCVLRQMKHLKHLQKHMKNSVKYTQHPDKTLITYV
jgi:hypothetical protein